VFYLLKIVGRMEVPEHIMLDCKNVKKYIEHSRAVMIQPSMTVNLRTTYKHNRQNDSFTN